MDGGKERKSPIALLGGIFLVVGLVCLGVFWVIARALEKMAAVYPLTGALSGSAYPRWLPFLAFLLVGGIFAALGAGFLLSSWRKRARRRWLEENGVAVQAKVTGVSQPMYVTVGSRHPYVVKAVFTHPYTGVEVEAKSGYLMEDPAPFIQDGTVEVLVDPMREKRYCVKVGQGVGITDYDENGWYRLLGDQETPCYQFFFFLGFEDGYQGPGKGVYHAAINVQDGTVEDILYDPDLAGNG